MHENEKYENAQHHDAVGHRRRRGRAARRLLAAVAVAVVAVPAAVTGAAAASAEGQSTAGAQASADGGPTSIAYVEVNDEDLSNVGRYTLEDGSNAFDVAIIFAANIDYDGTEAVLSLNERVQATLDDAENQIRPLQAKGIDVSLSVLGNHQGARIANFTSPEAAADFAAQVADVVERYGLDGVDLSGTRSVAEALRLVEDAARRGRGRPVYAHSWDETRWAEQRPVTRPAARRFNTRSADREPNHLRVTSGPLAGTSLPLREAGILIGRSPESALVLDDDFASGRHARIYKGSDGWVVEDLGSTNGTFIGPMRLTVATPVTAGTEIRFGTTVVELRR